MSGTKTIEYRGGVLGFERAYLPLCAGSKYSAGWGRGAEAESRCVVGDSGGDTWRDRASSPRVWTGFAAARSGHERLSSTYAGWREIVPGDHVRFAAAQVLDRYPLRAADALQLGAALTWCDGRPSGYKFVCRDARLSRAAGQEGFEVVGL